MTRLLASFKSLSLFTLVAIAEPIAVLEPSIEPISTLAMFCKSQSWFKVRGETTNVFEAKMVIPILSFGRFFMNCSITFLTASRRV